jgi:hypothetical protein
MPRKGQACETAKKIEYGQKGCTVIPTGKGHDFLTICPNEKATFHEVKKGCGDLTEFQKKTRAEVTKSGFGYEIDRCSCTRKTKR